MTPAAATSKLRPAARALDALDVAYETPWGTGWLRVEAGAITVVRAPTSPSRPRDLADAADAPPVARDLAARLTRWFGGDPVELATPRQVAAWLDAAGVEGFRRRALEELVRVPRGVTITYGELAGLAGSPGAARAVGSACGSNPLWLVVPCHRVVPAGRSLGRYGDLGPDYKRRLLQLEGVALRA